MDPSSRDLSRGGTAVRSMAAESFRPARMVGAGVCRRQLSRCAIPASVRHRRDRKRLRPAHHRVPASTRSRVHVSHDAAGRVQAGLRGPVDRPRLPQRLLGPLRRRRQDPRAARRAAPGHASGRRAESDSLYRIRFFTPEELRGLVTGVSERIRRVSIEPFGGGVDRLYRAAQRVPALGGLLRPMVPRLYRMQAWSQAERLALVMELE